MSKECLVYLEQFVFDTNVGPDYKTELEQTVHDMYPDKNIYISYTEKKADDSSYTYATVFERGEINE